MVTKKTVKKDEAVEKEEAKKDGVYFYAVGKRKTAIAQVRIYPVKKLEKGIVVNNRKMEEYFSVARWQEVVKSPMDMAGQDNIFDVTIKVVGGGTNAQAEAIRLGLSRALVKFDENLKKSLRDRGYLTRDARIVERKKAGLKKARKAPQWAKR